MISVQCLICGRVLHGTSTADWPDYPFCGKRCKLIDLGRWLGEDYRLPPPDPADAVDPDGSSED